MADQNGRPGQLPNCICHVLNVVENSRPAQVASSLAVSVPTQSICVGREAMLSEVIEKMHIPTSGPMQGSVYKKERCWVRAVGRKFGDDF
jgi:hypothetical protein